MIKHDVSKHIYPTNPFGHGPHLSISPSLCMTTSAYLQIVASARDHGEEQRHPVADAYLNRVSAHKMCAVVLTFTEEGKVMKERHCYGCHCGLAWTELCPLFVTSSSSNVLSLSSSDAAQSLTPAPSRCLPHLRFGLTSSARTRSACSCQPSVRQE